DRDGFHSFEMEFSTVIIDGFTGTSTFIYNNVSGNKIISVPDASLYEINITNTQVVKYSVNGNEFVYNKSITQVATEGFTNTAFELTQNNFNLNNTEFNNVETDVSGKPIINITYSNGVNIPFFVEKWNGENDFLIHIKVTSGIETKTLYFYYGDSGLTRSGSNGTYTFEFFDHFETMNTSLWHGDTGAVSVLNSILTVSGIDETINTITQFAPDKKYGMRSQILRTSWTVWGMRNTTGNDLLYGYFDNSFNRLVTKGDAETSIDTNWNITNVYTLKTITWGDSFNNLSWYENGVMLTNSPYTTSANIPDKSMNLTFKSDNNIPINVDYVYVTPLIENEPSYTAGDSLTLSGSTSIKAQVVGDSNTSTYNTGETIKFSLVPTSTNTNVTTTTTSNDYSITVKAYWTANTTQVIETVGDGYANINITFTPQYAIDSGVINTTYSLIDFSEHAFVGGVQCVVDGVNYNSNATRLQEDVNTTITSFDNTTHYINFSVPYNPSINLFAPNDTATLDYAYPPLSHSVVLGWNESTGVYKYTVSDYDTGAVVTSGTVYTNSTTVSIPGGHYRWYVNGYDSIFTEYSITEEIRSFTVSDTYSYTNDTVIHGVVYEYVNDVQTPLNNALVNIWNSSWSDSLMTGSNGYYVFTGLHNSTYSLRATKDGYVDSNIELCTPEFNTTLTRDILLQSTSGAGQQYVDHYVMFTVKSWLGTLYSGVEVNVYIGDAVIAQYTGDTGTDGSISFELSEDREYRITFIDAAQGIDETRTLYPKENYYEVIVFGANLIPDEPASNDITYSCYASSINLTHGFINVSFTDASGTTTLAELWINNTNMTNLYYFSTLDSSKSWSQVVTGGNASYVIVFKIDNTKLAEPLIINRYVSFNDAVNVNLGLDEGWKYQLIAVVIIATVGLLFSAVNAEIGAVLIVLTGWLMIFFGWLQAGNTQGENTTLYLMLLLATLIAFGAIIKGRGDKS
ncbi:MAG: DUF2341 domain-containing protein, partial [Gammaproteobacteria bacterium]|nr:DUF2341 domain-containing protein [Gammaproteobacteria bacterium]